MEDDWPSHGQAALSRVGEGHSALVLVIPESKQSTKVERSVVTTSGGWKAGGIEPLTPSPTARPGPPPFLVPRWPETN